jgi:hypothetical protein
LIYTLTAIPTKNTSHFGRSKIIYAHQPASSLEEEQSQRTLTQILRTSDTASVLKIWQR